MKVLAIMLEQLEQSELSEQLELLVRQVEWVQNRVQHLLEVLQKRQLHLVRLHSSSTGALFEQAHSELELLLFHQRMVELDLQVALPCQLLRVHMASRA